MVKVSIIVPVFNIEQDKVSRCIDSLINQTYKNIEIIIVDDGSTNNIIEKIKKRYNKQDKIIIKRKENGGVSSARNLGLKICSGEYIMFVDSDDWLESNCIYECIKKGYNNDLIFFTYIKEFQTSKKKIHFFKNDILNFFKTNNEKLYDMRILGSSCMKLYKKSKINEIFFDENLTNGEDVEFNLRLIKNIENSIYLNECYYHYDIHENSAVRNNSDDIIIKYEKTFKKMKKNLINENEKSLYYSFIAVVLLQLMINNVFIKENPYNISRKKIIRISNRKFFEEMLKNIKFVKLPITRKIPIIFCKYHLFVLCKVIINIKNRLEK